MLFAAVNVARKLKVDPELALRAASDRFRERVEGGGGACGARRRRLGRARIAEAQLDVLRAGATIVRRPMSQIETVHARQILDSRGNPTVEVEVQLR